MKKLLVLLLTLAIVLSGCSTSSEDIYDSQEVVDEVTESEVANEETDEVEEAPDEEAQVDEAIEEERGQIVIKSLDDIDAAIAMMTLEEKAGQLIQAERGGIQLSEVSQYNIGSILSGGGSVPSKNNPEGWITLTNRMQKVSRNSSSGIPLVYGIDAVHGNGNVADVTIFPHNIGLGAANDPELMEAIGGATAREVAATGVDWNFGPAVSCVQDIRWGRSYESYSEDINIVAALAAPYITGMQNEGVLATTKHFIGDGHVAFGTGEGDNLIDRGDVTVDREYMLEINLPAYRAAIEAGTKSIMASFNSVNGEKVHGDKYLLTDVLRGELGFEGLVVSDWEAIHTIAPTLPDQVAKSINAGVDLLMQPYNWKDVYFAIISKVEDGTISEERLNEAVRRNLVFKFEAGLFVDNFEKEAGQVGTSENKAIAREAVAKSMVLLENSGVLPLKKDAKVYLTGPASDNVGIQSGGWTREWQGNMDPDQNGGISLMDAMSLVLSENGGELVASPDEADVVVISIGEMPYTEMFGDTADLSMTGPLSLVGNLEAIEEAKFSGKPVVTIMIAGRPMLLEDYVNDWDALVMAWLPGTEGNGMTDVLFGDSPFTGKLPVTWPKTNDQAADSVIMDNYDTIDHEYKIGYGLTY